MNGEQTASESATGHGSDQSSAETRIKLHSFIWGALGASIIVGIFSLLQVLAFFSTVLPWLAGAALFSVLLGTFFVLLQWLKKMRRSQYAFWDCYTAIGVVSVLGFFAGACVQTFQPGGQPLVMWTYAALSAIVFASCFAVGKFAGIVWEAGRQQAARDQAQRVSKR